MGDAEEGSRKLPRYQSFGLREMSLEPNRSPEVKHYLRTPSNNFLSHPKVRGRIASSLQVLECEAHDESHVSAPDARLACTAGSIFQPLTVVAILGGVGADVLELCIYDFRKKYEAAAWRKR